MKKILVIEDTKSIIEEISAILSFENYSVLEAKNGSEGLELALKELPDLIISDILMPEIDGYTLRAELNKNPATANIPFIFFSAKASKEDIKKGLDLGVDDFLVKPFDPEVLINRIKKIFI